LVVLQSGYILTFLKVTVSHSRLYCFYM